MQSEVGLLLSARTNKNKKYTVHRHSRAGQDGEHLMRIWHKKENTGRINGQAIRWENERGQVG